MSLKNLVIPGSKWAIKHFLGSHQRELGITLKGFSLAKYWTVWAWVSIRHTCIQIYTVCLNSQVYNNVKISHPFGDVRELIRILRKDI